MDTQPLTSALAEMQLDDAVRAALPSGQRSSALPLNEDCLVHVMSLMDDYMSLRNLMLSCRAARACFVNRRWLIVNAIGDNAFGSALPFALRAVHSLRVHFEDLVEDDEECHPNWAMPSIPPEDEFPETARSWSFTTARMLDKLALHAREMELSYSQLNIDLSVAHSVLSPEESFRFRRALLRREALAAIFGSFFDPSDVGAATYLASEAEHARDIQAFITEYSNDEIMELWEIDLFMRNQIWGIRRLAMTPSEQAANASCWTADRIAAFRRAPHSGVDEAHALGAPFSDCSFVADAVAGLRARDPGRMLDEPSAHLTYVARHVDGYCEGCLLTKRRVYGKLSWRFLDVDPDADSLHDLISRPALTNALYGQALTVYLDTHGHADLVPDLLGNDKCFCAECVQRRILQAFEGWWRARMRHAADLELPLQACRYGRSCSAQDELGHARGFNHLCDPVADDPRPFLVLRRASLLEKPALYGGITHDPAFAERYRGRQIARIDADIQDAGKDEVYSDLTAEPTFY